MRNLLNKPFSNKLLVILLLLLLSISSSILVVESIKQQHLEKQLNILNLSTQSSTSTDISSNSNSSNNNDDDDSSAVGNSSGEAASSSGSSDPVIPNTDGLSSVTTFVSFTGGSQICNNSNCGQGYNYSVNYACSYEIIPGVTRGNWGNGVKYFQDPLPANVLISQIQGIQFTIWGSFGCNNDNTLTVMEFTIQNLNIFSMSTNNSDVCFCGSCFLTHVTDVYQYRPASYNFTGINKFQILVTQNSICANNVFITLYYNKTIPPPTPTPTISPSPPSPSPSISPSPTPTPTVSPYSGLLSPQVKKYIIIASSITGGLLAAIFAFVFIRRRLKKKTGYVQIKDGKDIDIHQIKIGERIGKGNFGEVFLGTWRGSKVAVKKLPFHNINENILKEFHREIDLMKNLRHPNVIQFLGSCSIPPDICICTEYMPKGSLYSILHNEKLSISWNLVIRMMIDAAKGVIYLHGSNPVILHRDLKSHNLLVDENWKVKVADFGLSTIERQGATMTACGTPCWTSPEVLRSQRYTEKADVYSFGIILWECATREDPYFGIPPFQVIFAVGREGLRPPLPKVGPLKYIQLIVDCLNENPTNRPTMEECLERLESIDTSGYQDILFSVPTSQSIN